MGFYSSTTRSKSAFTFPGQYGGKKYFFDVTRIRRSCSKRIEESANRLIIFQNAECALAIGAHVVK